jgi:hypothetical protein
MCHVYIQLVRFFRTSQHLTRYARDANKISTMYSCETSAIHLILTKTGSGGKINEQRIGRDMEEIGSGLSRRFFAALASSNISCSCRCPGRDLKPGPPEYKAGVPIARPQHSVHTVAFISLRVSVSKVYRSVYEEWHRD